MQHTKITLHQDDKIRTENISANTPAEAHKEIGKYLAKQFSGQIKVLEYHYIRGV